MSKRYFLVAFVMSSILSASLGVMVSLIFRDYVVPAILGGMLTGMLCVMLAELLEL
jgi:hypothetical protein